MINSRSVLSAALNALAQMLTPPFRRVLLLAIALALVLIVAFGISVHRLLAWLAAYGEVTAEGALGPSAHTPLGILFWVISFAAAAGVIAGSVFLMPAVTSLVASFFVDDIALEVEHEYYPLDPPGAAVPLSRAVWEGVKTALLAVLVYLVALPLILFAGFGAVIFFLATGYILGRQYFELAAMRFRPPLEAKAMRRRHAGTVFGAGLLIAAFVSIPIVNLATPLFGMAFMVHMHKLLSARQERIAAQRHAPQY
jgi:uncharacterized protein involved in cysteine biosynthesis